MLPDDPARLTGIPSDASAGPESSTRTTVAPSDSVRVVRIGQRNEIRRALAGALSALARRRGSRNIPAERPARPRCPSRRARIGAVTCPPPATRLLRYRARRRASRGSIWPRRPLHARTRAAAQIPPRRALPARLRSSRSRAAPDRAIPFRSSAARSGRTIPHAPARFRAEPRLRSRTIEIVHDLLEFQCTASVSSL